MQRSIRLGALLLLVPSAAAWADGAFDWPQWQGPDRNAISKETGLLKEWTEAGPPLAWTNKDLGGGYSAPSIAAGRIFAMSNRGEDEVVWALSEKDGKELWATRLGPAVRQGMRQGIEGPGGTPTVDGDRLYALGAGGALACVDVDDGKVIWQRSLTSDFGGRLPTWRYNESPLVDGDKVICTPGASDAVLVALDKASGKLLWKGTLAAAAKGEAAASTVRSSPAARGARGSGSGQGRTTGEAPLPAGAKPVTLIGAGSEWRYLDTGKEPGSGWTTAKFDDGAWRSGLAQFGYGDGDEKTRLSDDRDNYPAYYFRKAFDVKDPGQLKVLVLRLLRDDGAVVYLNGKEIVRDNMPSGSLERETFASGTTFVEDDFYVHAVPKGSLLAGRNVIAVAVHQASADSSDVSFDLELREKIASDVLGAPRSQGRGGFGRGRGGRGGSEAGYSSAIAIDFEGQRQYVQLTATTLAGFAAADGRLLWRYDRPANRNRINCSTPLYHDGVLFAASAYGNGGGAVKLTKKSDGTISAEEIYFTPRMQNHHGGMIVVDGCLYGANGGNGGGYLACLDFKTGDVNWRERQAPKGSILLADERLYLRSEDGEIILIEPNREKFIERGRFEQPDRTRSPAWTHPVIANGKLYVRDQNTLFCYDVKAR